MVWAGVIVHLKTLAAGKVLLRYPGRPEPHCVCNLDRLQAFHSSALFSHPGAQGLSGAFSSPILQFRRANGPWEWGPSIGLCWDRSQGHPSDTTAQLVWVREGARRGLGCLKYYSSVSNDRGHRAWRPHLLLASESPRSEQVRLLSPAPGFTRPHYAFLHRN